MSPSRAPIDRERIRPGLSTEEALAAEEDGAVFPDFGMAAMVLHRVGYFTEGAVMGSRGFTGIERRTVPF